MTPIPRSVWYDLEPPPRAAALELRSALMMKLQEHLRRQGWSSKRAAQRCGLTAPRLQELRDGRIGHFDLEALIAIATQLDLRVELAVVPTEG
jgi:predicted XRE-type DNA-binding protein